MRSFLEHIANHILKNYSDKMEKQCIVFPNRRAGIFFRKYLASLSYRPVWSPAIKTINDLFAELSCLKIAENELIVFELFKEYRKLSARDESFDNFYYWGEMLLNDFDDVDKYLVDANKIFSNLSDLKDIDQRFGELTEEQIKILKQFWINFNEGKLTGEKRDFISIWNILPDLYQNFRNNLVAKGLAYEGMIFREVAEKCLTGNLPALKWEMFHFAGFNALNRSEKTLFRYLRERGQARFYWDYDELYIKDYPDHSAGYFIRDNLSEFGNDMPGDWSYRTLFSETQGERIKRKIISTTSDIAQVKLIPELLPESEQSGCEDAHNTAIILADENLLIPLLTSIPADSGEVNITMGYPLRFSPVYSLVKSLLSLQKNCRSENGVVLFAYDDVVKLLNHPFLSDEEIYRSRSILSKALTRGKTWIMQEELCLTPQLQIIFSRIESQKYIPEYLKKVLENQYIIQDEGDEPEIRDMLHNEFLFRTLQVLKRIEMIISGSEIEMSIATWARLFDNIIRNLSVPFSGEPLSGLQIMGILETRALDFRNIIMLSVNEGIIPRNSVSASYIPWNLREAFNLPVMRHQDSVYSYYFYRLLHRAENAVFIYNSNADGLRTGEMSRFLLQLTYLHPEPPLIFSSGYEIGARAPFPEITERNENHQNILEDKYLQGQNSLSPGAINTWLSCRMKFYYKYICNIEEPDKITEGIDPASFGNLLHQVMEKIYAPFVGKTVDEKIIKDISSDENLISNKIRELITKTFHSIDDTRLSGSEQIAASVLAQYIRMILEKDAKSSPLEIIALEKELYTPVKINYSGMEHAVRIGGIIDRIDRIADSLRIIDYKTGNISLSIKTPEDLFNENMKDRPKEWLQILIYCEVFYRHQKGKIYPVIYTVRKLQDPEYSGILIIKEPQWEIVVDNYECIREPFTELLRNTIEVIFNINEPFRMTENKYICRYCPYISLCRRI